MNKNRSLARARQLGARRRIQFGKSKTEAKTGEECPKDTKPSVPPAK